jgi:transcriptional regulator with XRE-family HTH domain
MAMKQSTMKQANGDFDSRIGARIHALRSDGKLTLDDLAGRTGVSRAMLSRIERGESSPTAHLLSKICGGLGVILSVLFAETEAAASPLSRRSDQRTWRDPASRYLRRHVSPPGTGSPVDIVEVEFPAGGKVAFDSQRLPGTDQHVWLLDGSLELTLGAEKFRLEQGDCLMMGFDRPIQFHNPTKRPIRYAVVISHPGGRP